MLEFIYGCIFVPYIILFTARSANPHFDDYTIEFVFTRPIMTWKEYIQTGSLEDKRRAAEQSGFVTILDYSDGEENYDFYEDNNDGEDYDSSDSE